MKHSEISVAFGTGPATRSWDAVCALSAGRVNNIFLQQFLAAGPSSPAGTLRAIADIDGRHYWLLDLRLGPLDISFSPAQEEHCRVQIPILDGWAVEYDMDKLRVQSGLQLVRGDAFVTGELDLTPISGEVGEVGRVVADLGTGTYKATIATFDPASDLAAKLGAAIGNVFENQDVRYLLGTVHDADVPACLRPTAFRIQTQKDPSGATDGCVLLLIQTDGSAGSLGELDTYPIPSGRSAALMVSNQVLFNRLIPPYVTHALRGLGTGFHGRADANGVYSCVSSGGTLNLGSFSSDDNLTYSSDDDGYEASVRIGVGGMTLYASDSRLKMHWSHGFHQYWSHTDETMYGPHTTTKHLSMTCGYSLTNSTHVDPDSDRISFSGSGSASFDTAESYSWWQKLFLGDFDVPSEAEGRMRHALNGALEHLSLPSVDTFALGSLLFPSSHALSLTDASVPCDLLATGNLAPSMQVNPSRTLLGPGGSRRFQVVDAQGQARTGFAWGLQQGSPGTIDDTGLYRAPADLDRTQVAVVEATDEADRSKVARGLATLYLPLDPNALFVSPSRMLVSAGQQLSFMVKDDQGKGVEAVCTRSPELGTLEEDGWTTGLWYYTAPASLDRSQTVTITAGAKADPEKTGQARVDLLQNETILLSSTKSGIVPGDSLKTEAVIANGCTEFQWGVYPLDNGSIQPDPDDSSKAIFTASRRLSGGQTHVIACGVRGATGVGHLSLNHL